LLDQCSGDLCRVRKLTRHVRPRGRKLQLGERERLPEPIVKLERDTTAFALFGECRVERHALQLFLEVAQRLLRFALVRHVGHKHDRHWAPVTRRRRHHHARRELGPVAATAGENTMRLTAGSAPAGGFIALDVELRQELPQRAREYFVRSKPEKVGRCVVCEERLSRRVGHEDRRIGLTQYLPKLELRPQGRRARFFRSSHLRNRQ
jgi:hypothetical protein